MATITGVDFNQDKYRTPIDSPSDGQLVGNVVVTLKDAPIGQPNFVRGQAVIVVRTAGGGTQTMQGIIDTAVGPSKYSVRDLIPN